MTTLIAPAAALTVPWTGSADPAVESRYPFDPACPWGRLANGKGMITRCLGEDEARALLAGGTLTTTSGTTVAIRGLGDAVAPGTQSGPQPTPAASQRPEAPPQAAPIQEPPTTAPEPPAQDVPSRPVRVEVGPVLPDEGQLTIGQLGKPVDRYRACVDRNGGLTASTGEVRVHFLVRGERSRAEGVEVTEYRGVTKKAAQCLADVVDRRATGTPSLPLVGATLVFKISQ
jgi:hypothetical protein